MQGRSKKDLPDKKMQKESQLRNRFQQAIQFYQKLFFEMGSQGEIADSANKVIIKKEVLNSMIKAHRLTHIRGEQLDRMT